MNVNKFNICIAKIMKRKENINIIVSSEEGRLRTTKLIVAIQTIKWHVFNFMPINLREQ